jgi:hypothetical protein
MRATDAVTQDRRSSLIGELLSAADEHRDEGHGRVALTEAVSALEVALARYATQADRAGPAPTIGGVNVKRLANHFERFGLRATVQFLLPLLLTPERLPRATLESVIEAIETRNNVVHQGKRDVENQHLRGYLMAIRQLVEALVPSEALVPAGESVPE